MKWMTCTKVESTPRKLVLLVLMTAVPAFAWAQHKNTPPKSAPAPHASAPAHNSQPHSAPPQHSNAPSSHGNGSGGGHSAQGGSGHQGGGAGGNNAGNSRGPMNHQGAGGNANNNRGGANGPGHGNNNANSSRGGNNGPGNARGNANGNRNAGNNMGGRNGNNGPGRGNNANHMNAHNGPGGRNGAGARGNRTPPGRQVTLKGGGNAHIRPNGQIRSVNRNGMRIEHGMHGQRRVVSQRNGVRVVTVGRRGGYVQRAYVVRGGRSYYSRTYVYHGVYRTGVYRGYYYGGRPYYGYYPAYYYRPVYYGWAYNPWPAPVYYGWGWNAAPWYGYYGPYYRPYPVYPSAAFWITDFMIAATLQTAYEAEYGDNWMSPYKLDGTLVASLNPPAAAETKAAMSDEVKKEIAEEVKAALAAEQDEAAKPKSNASSGGQATETKEAPPALDPKFKTFIVSADLSLDTDGDECALAQGDVITRTGETPDDDGNVDVKVVASSKADCAVGTEGSVSTDDLQEMYNHFRESLKDGMGELAKKNGTGGLPKAPDTTTVNGDVPAPEADKSAEKSLKEQQAAADETESEVKKEAGSGGGQ